MKNLAARTSRSRTRDSALHTRCRCADARATWGIRRSSCSRTSSDIRGQGRMVRILRRCRCTRRRHRSSSRSRRWRCPLDRSARRLGTLPAKSGTSKNRRRRFPKLHSASSERSRCNSNSDHPRTRRAGRLRCTRDRVKAPMPGKPQPGRRRHHFARRCWFRRSHFRLARSRRMRKWKWKRNQPRRGAFARTHISNSRSSVLFEKISYFGRCVCATLCRGKIARSRCYCGRRLSLFAAGRCGCCGECMFSISSWSKSRTSGFPLR